MNLKETNHKEAAASLIEGARLAREKAYVPYSEFKVGAAVLSADGRVFTACNVENSSYGLSICAERAAVFKAVSEGARELLGVAIIADSPDPVTPCGACRQVLSEFGLRMEVTMANLEGLVSRARLDELLPGGFNARQLGRKDD